MINEDSVRAFQELTSGVSVGTHLFGEGRHGNLPTTVLQVMGWQVGTNGQRAIQLGGAQGHSRDPICHGRRESQREDTARANEWGHEPAWWAVGTTCHSAGLDIR